jgi:hypothetical protein
MSSPIRLGCHSCDREDFDGIGELPSDWLDISVVQSLEESCQEVELSDRLRSPLEWYTHLGTCPDCQAEEK